MRGIRVWARLLGIQRAVVEDVRIGDEGEIVVAVRPVGASVSAAVFVGDAALAMTSATGAGGGVRWISARRWRSSKLRRRG